MNELNIGGRNLIKGTANFDTKFEPYFLQPNYAGNAGYVDETFRGNKVVKLIYNWQGFQCRTTFEKRPMIISFWAKTTKPNINIYYIVGESSITYPDGNTLISDGQWHRYTIYGSNGIVTSNGSNQGFLEFNCTSVAHIEEVYVSSFKIEYGNKPTDWSPAPEDVWDTMVDLGIIDKNAMNLTEAEKANVKFINGMFSKGADYTNGTEIVKNTITTGALTVGNTLGGNAGINGAGLDGKSIRFFAGANYRDKENAPFRVQDDGSVYASKGQIGNFKIESASETSLKANGLHIASQGLIRALGNGKDSRTTQVRINDPEIFKTFDKSAVDVYSSGHNDTTHSAMKLESRGGRKSTALILKAIWGQEESVALDVVEGDVKINGKTNFYGEIRMHGQKGYSNTHEISNHRITIVNGIITNIEYTG